MTKRIIFVDDDPNIVQGLERMLRDMRNEWEMEFVQSASEALHILNTKAFDIIVTDMQMPELNGAQLLEKVLEFHPQIIRIILSGHSDQEMIIKAAKPAHIFLAKPCEPDTLKTVINRSIKIINLLKNDPLKTLIIGAGALPSYPPLYQKLLEQLRQPDVSFEATTEIIMHDVAMAAFLLKLINSSFFSNSQRINQLEEALGILGIENLKKLVLDNHIFSVCQNSELNDFLNNLIFEHSIHVSRIAKEIALLETTDKDIANKAFIAGLLHDIGKLLIFQSPQVYKDILDYQQKNSCSFFTAQSKVLEMSHAELGASLLGLWGNPDWLIDVITYHHTPTKLGETQFTPLTAVYVANILVNHGGWPHNGTQLDDINSSYLEALNLSSRLSHWTKYLEDLKLKRGGHL